MEGKAVRVLASLLLLAAFAYSIARCQDDETSTTESSGGGEASGREEGSRSPTSERLASGELRPETATEPLPTATTDAQSEPTEDTEEQSRPSSSGPSTELQNSCSFVFHNLTYERNGCTGHTPAISCKGQCKSEAIPLLYSTNEDVDYQNNCRCCAITASIETKQDVVMHCPDGTKFIETIDSVPTGVGCGCTTCGPH